MDPKQVQKSGSKGGALWDQGNVGYPLNREEYVSETAMQSRATGTTDDCHIAGEDADVLDNTLIEQIKNLSTRLSASGMAKVIATVFSSTVPKEFETVNESPIFQPPGQYAPHKFETLNVSPIFQAPGLYARPLQQKNKVSKPDSSPVVPEGFAVAESMPGLANASSLVPSSPGTRSLVLEDHFAAKASSLVTAPLDTPVSTAVNRRRSASYSSATDFPSGVVALEGTASAPDLPSISSREDSRRGVRITKWNTAWLYNVMTTRQCTSPQPFPRDYEVSNSEGDMIVLYLNDLLGYEASRSALGYSSKFDLRVYSAGIQLIENLLSLGVDPEKYITACIIGREGRGGAAIDRNVNDTRGIRETPSEAAANDREALDFRNGGGVSIWQKCKDRCAGRKTRFVMYRDIPSRSALLRLDCENEERLREWNYQNRKTGLVNVRSTLEQLKELGEVTEIVYLTRRH